MKQELLGILKKYWGYESFRPLQLDIIQSVLSGKDTLAILPTGGGKSICYQIPGLYLEGITVVISPLIALMKDQADRLHALGIFSVVLHAGLHHKQVDILLDNCIYGQVKFLFVSPERLQSPLFLERVKKMKVSLLAVDEAHCISEWGYDFRPSYLLIKEFREAVLPKHVLALTATAPENVRNDIITYVPLNTPYVFVQSFKRENISYSVFEENDKENKVFQILKNVPGSSIVYVRNRKKTKEIADLLAKNGFSAGFYHAGLSHKERSDIQDRWIKGYVRVIVATNAFGMGIDKPNVRTVIHWDMPNSLEAYYQEAGRAGRDGQKSFAVFLYDQGDIADMNESLQVNFPGFHFVRQVYQCLVNHLQVFPDALPSTYFPFQLSTFSKKYELDPRKAHAALKALDKQGIIVLNEAYFQPSQLFIPVDNKKLYEFQVANAAWDVFIKTVVRLYGGELFSGYKKISEALLGEKLGVSKEKVAEGLLKLTQWGIFDYLPQNEEPHVSFTYSGPVAGLPLKETELKTYEEREIGRWKSVLQYVTQQHMCRSVQLCMYFDEMTASDCGVCDVCIKKKKELASFSPEDVADKVKILFQHTRILSLQAVIERLGMPKDQGMEIIRYLLENNKLRYISAQQLEWINTE